MSMGETRDAQLLGAACSRAKHVRLSETQIWESPIRDAHNLAIWLVSDALASLGLCARADGCAGRSHLPLNSVETGAGFGPFLRLP